MLACTRAPMQECKCAACAAGREAQLEYARGARETKKPRRQKRPPGKGPFFCLEVRGAVGLWRCGAVGLWGCGAVLMNINERRDAQTPVRCVHVRVRVLEIRRRAGAVCARVCVRVCMCVRMC